MYNQTLSLGTLNLFLLNLLGLLQTQGSGELMNRPTLVPQGSPTPPYIMFPLPAARERHHSVPEIGEKEMNYLFKELYRLRVMT